jgi:hypothetical protein
LPAVFGLRRRTERAFEILTLIETIKRGLNDAGYWPASIWFFSPSPFGPPAMSTNVGNQSSAANS